MLMLCSFVKSDLLLGDMEKQFVHPEYAGMEYDESFAYEAGAMNGDEIYAYESDDGMLVEDDVEDFENIHVQEGMCVGGYGWAVRVA